MENNNTDQNIKGKFDSHEISVNTTELWNNIAPHIKPPKSNKRKIIIFLLLGLFGVSTIIYAYKSLEPSQKISSINPFTQNENHSNTELAKTKNPIEIETASDEMNETETTLSQSSVSNLKPDISASKPLNALGQSAKLGSSQLPKTIAASDNNYAILESKPTAPVVLTEDTIRETLNQATIPLRVSNEDVDDETSDELFKRTSLDIDALLKTSIPFLAIRPLHVSPSLKLDQEHKSSIKYMLYLGATAGIAKPEMILKATKQEHQEYADYRISIEKPLESYFTSVHAELRLPQWWSLSLGAQYTEQHYSSDHTISYLEDFNYEDVTIEIIQSQNGQQSEIKGNMLGKKEITVSGVRYHNYRNLAARADLGIWKSWNRHTVHGKIAYSFPLMTFHSGLLYDAPVADYDLAIDVEQRLKKASTYHASIHYEFELLNQHKITLGSYFSYEENIFNIDYRLNQMQRSLGLQVGYLIKI